MSEKIDDSLLTPDNHALLMIDHQYLQLLALRIEQVQVTDAASRVALGRDMICRLSLAGGFGSRL